MPGTDFLGNTLEAGDIVLCANSPRSDYSFGVVYKFGKGTAYLAERWRGTRKTDEFLVKVSEEDVMNSRLHSWKERYDNGEEEIRMAKIKTIRLSRMIKEMDLGEYNTHNELELEALREIVHNLK